MSDLTRLREDLDEADGDILAAVARRFEVIRAIAEYKKAHGVAMMQSDRVAFVERRYRDFATEAGITPDLLGRIAQELIEAACDLELQLMGDADPPSPGESTRPGRSAR